MFPFATDLYKTQDRTEHLYNLSIYWRCVHCGKSTHTYLLKDVASQITNPLLD